MKKLFYLLMAGTIVLSACDKNDDDVNSSDTTTTEKKTYWDKPVCTLNEKGDTIYKWTYNDDLMVTGEYYNWNNSEYPWDSEGYNIPTYNDKGQIIKIENHIKSNGMESTTLYEYDTNSGLVTKKTNEQGEVTYQCTIDGLTKTSYYEEDFVYLGTIYDESGFQSIEDEISKVVFTYKDNNFRDYSVIEYDKDNNEIWSSIDTYDNNRIVSTVIKYKDMVYQSREYTYKNKESNILNQYYHIENNGGHYLETKSLDYILYMDDEYKYPIEKGTIINDDTRKIYNKIEYDNQNRVVKLINYNYNGDAYYTTIEYFEDRMVKTSDNEYSSTPKQWKETTYYLVK